MWSTLAIIEYFFVYVNVDPGVDTRYRQTLPAVYHDVFNGDNV